MEKSILTSAAVRHGKINSHFFGKSQMGLRYMGLNFFKEIAKMSLELLGLLLELLLLLLLLLLHVFDHILLRGREAPP